MTIQDFQVLQRGPGNTARVVQRSGETIDLRAGGPYEIDGARDVLVGDLWVLAGQSNMEGVGDLVDVEPPQEQVRSFQSREQWAVAEEPLHWLGESPRLVHHRLWGRETVPSAPDPRDPARNKGAGLGLAFARAYHQAVGVPVGLIPSAHGGTSMEQWDPALKSEGGGSLYGATVERVRANGGKIRGILWYQGESDCWGDALAVYTERMKRLIESFRSDFGDPALPFYYVQIGCFVAEVNPDGTAGWNGIREAQRRLVRELPGLAMVSAIDLELDDLIHIGTQGLRRLGRRLARVAVGQPAPDLRDVQWAEGFRLRVTFDGVSGGLTAPDRPAGFSLRNAAGQALPLIFKVTLEGDDAVLHLVDTTPEVLQGVQLWYGWGLNPYCNLRDAAGMAVPAFGPVNLPPRR